MSPRKKFIVAVFCILAFWTGLTLFVPGSFSDARSEVSIPMGTGVSGMARELKRAHLIRSTVAFRLACLVSGNTRKMKAGDYEIPRDLSAWQVMDLLASGKAIQRRFLIPEGLSSFQIAALLQEKKLADAWRFMALVKDPLYIKSLGIKAPSLEGWLFPDSYQINRGVSEEVILGMMVERFRKQVPDSLLEQGKASGLNSLQVLTLASIVEKEARADAERPKVARVFLNRKKKGMRLESCATVRFALKKYKGPVLLGDLEVRSPYNSYRHWGLPPGPICSPGVKSIEAALNPDKGEWLFFVVAGDGTHVFSETFEQHIKAKLRHKRLRRGVVEEEGA